MRPTCFCEDAGHDTRRRCANCPKRAPEPQLEEVVIEAEEKIDDALIVFDILNS